MVSITDTNDMEIGTVEHIIHEVSSRTICFPNCFSNAEAETVDEWLRSFVFAWNQRI